MDKSRYNYIDIAKGLAMLAVVWGHCHLTGPSHAFVYAFDIPLFFFVSGMMFKKEKYGRLGDFLKSRGKTLLIPYVIFSVATWLVFILYCKMSGNEDTNLIYPLLQTLYAQGTVDYIYHNVPLWFVTCLFVVELLYYFICRLPDIWNVLVCVLCAAAGYFMVFNNLRFDFTKLPWNTEVAMSALLFYCLGNLFVKHFRLSSLPEWTEKNKYAAIAATAVLTVLLAAGSRINGAISLGGNKFGRSPVLLYVTGVTGVFSTLFFSNLMALPVNAVVRKSAGAMKWIGRNSFYFMALHEPIRRFVTLYAMRFAPLLGVSATYASVVENPLHSAFIFLITLLCTAFAVFLINYFKKKLGVKGFRQS